MRSRAAWLFGLLLIVLADGPAMAAKRVALVIGNAAYSSAGRLANPENDATAVADLLRRAQFEVVEFKTNLNNADMRRALRDFSVRSRQADYAIVYYAGHGIEIDGTNYLLPVDAVLDQDSDAYDEAVTLDRVLQAIEPAKALRLVILDACRDNPFARTMKRSLGGRVPTRGLASVEPGKANTLIAFAAKGGSIADDGRGSNSPFTTALIQHLTTPGLDLRKAFGRIRDDVMKATNDRQESFLYGSLGGTDVALVPGSIAPHAAASQLADNPHGESRRDYELTLQLGTRQAWESFLTQYPTGFFANLARGQLEKLVASDEHAIADRRAKDNAETAAQAIRDRALADAKAIRDKAEADLKLAEDARKAAWEETERLRKVIAKLESGGIASRPEPIAARVRPALESQIVCDFQGCRPVRKGCRIGQANLGGAANAWSREVCD